MSLSQYRRMRTAPEQVTDLLTSAHNAKSGKVMYPTRMLKPELLNSVAHDLRDYEVLDANLDRAISLVREWPEGNEFDKKDLLCVLEGLRK